jgi:hypothetical protein
LKTIAVAVEMHRVPKLNFTASCARHDIRDALGQDALPRALKAASP